MRNQSYFNKNCARFVGSQAGAKDFHLDIFLYFIKLMSGFSSTVTMLLPFVVFIAVSNKFDFGPCPLNTCLKTYVITYYQLSVTSQT